MPLYEYQCTTCGHHVELFQAMDDPHSAVPCPACVMGGMMTRIVSVPAVHFHGAGFTRQPSIMREPIAADSQMQRTNWGTTSTSELGGAPLEDD
jgi:putative FmdB family regulatory protein